MTATTQDISTKTRSGALRNVPMDDGDVVYAGSLVCVNTAGYAVDGADTSGFRFVGVAEEYKDNSGGADGDDSILVRESGEALLTVSGGCNQGDVGKPVYIKDNATVGLLDAVSNGVYVGVIKSIESATQAWVELRPNTQAPDGARLDETYAVQIVGVNATAFDLDSVASGYGGSGFYVTRVLSVVSYVTATGDIDRLKVVTTHYTLASGVISAVGDETANTWLITFLGRLLP